MRGEQFREETPSRWSARIIICVGSRTIVDSVIAVAVAMRNGWPGQTPLTEVSGSEQRDDRLLALVREDVILTFPRWMKNHTQSPSRAIIVLAGDPGKMPDCLLVRSSEPVRWP